MVCCCHEVNRSGLKNFNYFWLLQVLVKIECLFLEFRTLEHGFVAFWGVWEMGLDIQLEI